MVLLLIVNSACRDMHFTSCHMAMTFTTNEITTRSLSTGYKRSAGCVSNDFTK